LRHDLPIVWNPGIPYECSLHDDGYPRPRHCESSDRDEYEPQVGLTSVQWRPKDSISHTHCDSNPVDPPVREPERLSGLADIEPGDSAWKARRSSVTRREP
jgi:hypothetical protein